MPVEHSDVDNVAILLNLFRLIPQEIDFGPLLSEAKRQLHQEAALLARYAGHLGGHPGFEVPRVLPELTTPEVLTMTYLGGRPIESLREAPAAERNRVAAALLDLALSEVFEWSLVQTDPNFANYLYVAGDGKAGGRVQLLDFGATRDYPLSCRAAFRDLLLAALAGDEASIDRERFGRLPPPAMLFLHRKLGGLYLLFSHLRAKIGLRELIAPLLAGTMADVGAKTLPLRA